MRSGAAGGGGLLQGFRKKIGRYAAPYAPTGLTAAVAGESAANNGSHKWQAAGRGDDDGEAERFTAAVQRFEQQDRLLRELEVEIARMLTQVQAVSASVTGVAALFEEMLAYDPENHAAGAGFLAATKQIERDGAERMEQSIRFTILDPLHARLERHDELRVRLRAHSKLSTECESLHAVTEILKASRPEDDDKRVQSEVQLGKMLSALLAEQQELILQLEDILESHATANVLDLFTTMRLQMAVFFCHANKSCMAGLTSAEMEMVAEAGHPTKTPTCAAQGETSSMSLTGSKVLPKLTKVSSLASDGWTEVDRSSSSTNSPLDVDDEEEDEEFRASSITLEDFEMGRSPPALHGTITGNVTVHTVDGSRDASELVALASHPVEQECTETEATIAKAVPPQLHVGIELHGIPPPRRMTSPSPRSKAMVEPSTPRRTTSMLWSIRKTIQGRFSYNRDASSDDSRMIRQSSAPTQSSGLHVSGTGVALTSRPEQLSPKKPYESHMIPLTPTEWQAIEACLWEFDAKHDNPSFEAVGSAQDEPKLEKADFLSRLLHQKSKLFFASASFLCVDDLAHLAKVNRQLHSSLINCGPIWKQCIRSSELAPSIRSALWLSTFYESTPWRCNGSDVAPHCLPASRRRAMYDQLLAKVGTKLAKGLSADPSSKEEDAQLLVWLREIDVDVVRTCHKDMYDTTETEDWDTSIRSPEMQSLASSTSSSGEDSVESILTEMVATIVESGGETHSTQRKTSLGGPNVPSTPASTKQAVLEAKIRRILRAYVVYNPRVGYCQGMGFLVRLLTEVTEDEADIFWLFVGFSEPENDRNLYEPGMAVLQPLLTKFELLFSTHMPELHAHFQAEGVHTAAFCTRWFLTFFSSFETLSPALVLRLLDIFVIDGWRVIFSMALVILDELRELLLRCDLEGILRVLQFPRSYLPEADLPRQRQLVRHALAFSISRTINSI